MYNETKELNLLEKDVIGQNYFDENTVGTQFLSSKELVSFRKKVMLQYHLRPSYVLKKLIDVNFSPKILLNYIIFGSRIIFLNFSLNIF